MATKVDVNAKDNSGQAALHVTAMNRYEAVARQLLEHKADIDVKADGFTALPLAAMSGHEPVVWLLLEHKADIDAKYDGFTALLFAVGRGMRRS
jgi:ankyrin repeat protein